MIYIAENARTNYLILHPYSSGKELIDFSLSMILTIAFWSYSEEMMIVILLV